jgi:hypothetical protein
MTLPMPAEMPLSLRTARRRRASQEVNEIAPLGPSSGELTATSAPSVGESRVRAAVARGLGSGRVGVASAAGCPLLGEPSLAWVRAVGMARRRPSVPVLALSAVVVVYGALAGGAAGLARAAGATSRWAAVAVGFVILACAAFARVGGAAVAIGRDPDAAPLRAPVVAPAGELRAELGADPCNRASRGPCPTANATTRR